MKQASHASAALIVLALSACSQNPPDNIVIDHDAASPTANAVLPANPATQPDARTMKAEKAAADATGSQGPMMDQVKPMPGRLAGTAIPAAFQGRWGMVANDCTSTKSDTKGLITVGADKIRFYESTAKLTSVATNDPVHFVGNFDFAGEGQTWKRSEDLKLTGGGKVLARTDDQGNAKYNRCA